MYFNCSCGQGGDSLLLVVHQLWHCLEGQLPLVGVDGVQRAMQSDHGFLVLLDLLVNGRGALACWFGGIWQQRKLGRNQTGARSNIIEPGANFGLRNVRTLLSILDRVRRRDRLAALLQHRGGDAARDLAELGAAGGNPQIAMSTESFSPNGAVEMQRPPAFWDAAGKGLGRCAGCWASA